MQSNDAIRTQQTVLVVDHEAKVRAVARRVLEGVGYVVNDLCRFPYSVVALALALLVFASAVFFTSTSSTFRLSMSLAWSAARSARS